MTIFTCPQKKELFFVLEIVCPQYTFSLPDSGNCYFLVFQNACPSLTFTCPGQSGKCWYVAPCLVLLLQYLCSVKWCGQWYHVGVNLLTAVPEISWAGVYEERMLYQNPTGISELKSHSFVTPWSKLSLKTLYLMIMEILLTWELTPQLFY